MRTVLLLALIVFLPGCASNRASVDDPAEEEFGAPDLTVQAFIPPIILAGSGATIYISDLVANVGEGRSAEATIRYFISNEPDIDVSTAPVIGERTLRSLRPQEVDESMELPFVIPEGLNLPPLYLAACIDADDDVVEINEANNCTTSDAGGDSMIMTPAFYDGIGTMPDPDQFPR